MLTSIRKVKLGEGEVLVPNDCLASYQEMLTNRRIVCLSGAFTGEVESHNTLLALDFKSHKPIIVLITSPGGSLDSALLFYDTMRLSKSPIITVGRYCASAAALILAAGHKRYLYPHAKVLLHLPSSTFQGDTRDLEIQHQEIQKYKNRLVDILIECGVKKSRKAVLADIDRDFWLEPLEAIDYGLADAIMTPEIWQGLVHPC